jgi:hypothetical protein
MKIKMALIAIGAMAALIGGLTQTVDAAPQVRPTFIAYRLVDAEVSNVQGSTLFLKTSAGRLKIDVSGPAVPVLKTGDHVALGVTMIRHPAPASLPRDDELRSRPLQRLPAVIAALQRDTGVVSLRCDAGLLNVALPEAAIAGLHTGDRLAIELSLPSTSEVAALAGQPHNNRVGLAALLFAIFGRGR